MFAVHRVPNWTVVKIFVLHKMQHIPQFCSKAMPAKELFQTLILLTPVPRSRCMMSYSSVYFQSRHPIVCIGLTNIDWYPFFCRSRSFEFYLIKLVSVLSSTICSFVHSFMYLLTDAIALVSVCSYSLFTCIYLINADLYEF